MEEEVVSGTRVTTGHLAVAWSGAHARRTGGTL